MNRCEEILKHSINKGLKIEKDELYHSDTYLGSEYDEGLKHWKYIKKYKNSRGKTVYVYANKETHSNIQDTRAKAKSAYSDALYENRMDQSYNAVGKAKSYGQSDINKQWAHAYTKIGDSYIQDYENMLNRNKPTKVIKRDAKKAIKTVSTAISEIHADAVKRGTDFIEKIMKNFK